MHTSLTWRRLGAAPARLALILAAALAFPASSTGATQAPDTAWRARILAFANAHLQHTAWGPAHARRDYETTLALAHAEGITVDDDALYAAAYLHDMGGIPPYAKPGVDHGDRSAQLADSVLRAVGFPMDKAPLVKEIIDHHQYYRPPDTLQVAILFRDADILDFLGAIDVARIISLTTREKLAPDLPHAIQVIRKNMLEMPGRLQSAAAKREGQKRVQEMQRFLRALSAETDSLHVL
ncbi:MAG TPA: HD domain-containing protein [Gemmatimonadaceae bacterium]|nr:HD domain-containing protein [Gemmatimonadaceae bacterium]